MLRDQRLEEALDKLGQISAKDSEPENQRRGSRQSEIASQENLAGMQVVDRDGDRLGEVGEFIARDSLSRVSDFVLTDEARNKFVDELDLKRDAFLALREEMARMPDRPTELNEKQQALLAELSLVNKKFKFLHEAKAEVTNKIAKLDQCMARICSTKLNKFMIRIYHSKENDIDEDL